MPAQRRISLQTARCSVNVNDDDIGFLIVLSECGSKAEMKNGLPDFST
jgi:hypothetical protein